MSSEIAKGEKDKVEGKLRKEEGKATGDKSERIKGELKEIEGDIKKDIGKAKNKV